MDNNNNNISTRNRKISKVLEEVLAYIFLIAIVGGFIYFFILSEDLQEEVDKRDNLISTMRLKHNDYITGQDKVDTLLNSYTTNCTITIDGNPVSLEDLVRTISHLEDSIRKLNSVNHDLDFQKQSLMSRLNMYEGLYKSGIDDYDTLLQSYRVAVNAAIELRRKELILNSARRIYGFDIEYKPTDKGGIISGSNQSRADSARLLYHVYKNKIFFDSATNRLGVRN